MTPELRPARSLNLGERAALFNAAYEGYVVPFHLEEPTLAFMETSYDVDLDASLIALRDGELVGLANLAIRGDEGWVAGVGVVTSARRGGIGEMLMTALHANAVARGLKRVWLEVIVDNAGAFALYEKLGYRTVQDVEVWTLPAAEGDLGGSEVPPEEAKAEIPERHEPWQRADGTLAHADDLLGLVAGSGAAIYRRPGKNVQLLQIAGDAEPVLRSLRSLGNVSVLNLPADDPVADAFRELGGAVAVRQHEMVLEL